MIALTESVVVVVVVEFALAESSSHGVDDADRCRDSD